MDTSQAEQPPQTNGVSDIDEEERAKMRPVDIDADVREMERRKRVEMIMNSKLFREELERIIESQLKEGSGPSGLLQQISDMVGVSKQGGNVFKSSNCVIPVNDIRGIEAMGYAKGEKILRCKLGCLYRLIDLYGWAYGSSTLITARLNQDDEQFLVNPYGMLFHEVTASSLIKVDMQGGVIEQGTTNFSVNITAFSLHAAVHSARPDIKCIIHVHTPAVIAVSSLKQGLLPLSQESVVIGEVSAHLYLGGHLDAEEKDKLARNLGPINKILLLTNQGALCCGETIEEAFYNARNTVLASEIQLKLMPLGTDNLIVINDEVRKTIYDAAHRAPESTPRPDQPSILESKVERKWRVGGIEFEALMRMLDNAGFRTGYIYRHPLVKGEPPKPKNDVEVPPAVSSLGYLLEEEELYRQGLWKKLEGGRKGTDRSRWLNSPNTYQKVEILETGTTDPKKITKWVADGSPNHSTGTPVKIDAALQFVPKGTNPKEFKQRQQQIKDYRRADKISAGPQSHILEGVTWEEAKKMQDATVTQTGDHVVLMGAASKGIIQRGHQHNAMVYKSPYAKNPFDSITDEELNEYKKVVEKKTKGEYDTDYSESEGLSSAALNKRIEDMHIRSPTSITSETEEESHDEPQILRIETKTVPRASQPEVVLSDGGKLRNQQPYRTNSHAGHPKGSYLDPKPYHFHIVRDNQIAISHSTTFIQPSSSSYFTYNTPLRINIQNSNTISVDISINTIKSFIVPFATALKLTTVPINNKECQTSYMNTVDYTPLFIKQCKTNLDSFEKQILDQLKQNIFDEASQYSDTDSESDVRNLNSDVNQIVQFDENDQERNESISVLTPDILAMLPSTENSSIESDSEVIDNANVLVKNAERFVGELRKITDAHFDVADGVLNEAKSILQRIPNNDMTKSSDEGIEDCTLINETVIDVDDTASDAVNHLADLILEYLVQQCLEVKEIILCPEILHDPNLNKLLNKLKQLYNEYFDENVNAEQKNELRVSIASAVLKKLETDEKINGSGDSSESNTISDKIFTISELLNDILDKFFDLIENRNKLFHSTPESEKKTRLKADNDTFEITTFHQKTLNKSGSELYWISVSSSPKTPKRNIESEKISFDVDDSSSNKSTRLFRENALSPIPEESRNKSESELCGIAVSSCLKWNVESEKRLFDVNESLTRFKDNALSPIPEGPSYNLFNSDLEDELITVVSFENDENMINTLTDRSNDNCYHKHKVIVNNKVCFCRNPNASSNAFKNKKVALFTTCSENKENESLNNSGNWLGYEEAKF